MLFDARLKMCASIYTIFLLQLFHATNYIMMSTETTIFLHITSKWNSPKDSSASRSSFVRSSLTQRLLALCVWAQREVQCIDENIVHGHGQWMSSKIIRKKKKTNNFYIVHIVQYSQWLFQRRKIDTKENLTKRQVRLISETTLHSKCSVSGSKMKLHETQFSCSAGSHGSIDGAGVFHVRKWNHNARSHICRNTHSAQHLFLRHYSTVPNRKVMYVISLSLWGAFKRDQNWALKCTNSIFGSISAEDTDKMKKEMNLFETEAQRPQRG